MKRINQAVKRKHSGVAGEDPSTSSQVEVSGSVGTAST